MKTVQSYNIEVSDDLLCQWQSMVNTMAELAHVTAGLIMRLNQEEIEVFVNSNTKGNPYHPHDHEHFCNSGLYCETVIETKKPLLVRDALSDPAWKGNPDVKLNMISYLGFPILYPDETPFGTICILDNKPNEYNDAIYSLLNTFSKFIQQHLALLYMNHLLGKENADLMEHFNEIHALRGLIPICAQCKKIKDSDGYWQAVEKYIARYPESKFSHGYCPECAEKLMNELDEIKI